MCVGVGLDSESGSGVRVGGGFFIDTAPRPVLYDPHRHDRNRPLLRVPDPLSKLEELHALRDPLYREAAHVVVDGSHLVAAGVVQYLLREFHRQCKP